MNKTASDEKINAEIEVLKNLRHKNIIPVIECFIDDDSYNIITEFSSFGYLSDVFARSKNKKFSEKQTSFLIKQLLEAVKYLNSKNFIHTDIKPINILIEKIQISKNNSSEKFYNIKLVDFGSTNSLNKNEENLPLPFYISPEIINRKFNVKCDIWSIGMIMYQMLFGFTAFKGNNFDEVINSIKNDEINFYDILSDNCKDILKNMLIRDVDERYDVDLCLNHTFFNMFDYDDLVDDKNDSNSDIENSVIVINVEPKNNNEMQSLKSTKIINNDDKNNIDSKNKNLQKKVGFRSSIVSLYSYYTKNKNKLNFTGYFSLNNALKENYKVSNTLSSIDYPLISVNEQYETEFYKISKKFIHHYFQEVYNSEAENKKLLKYFENNKIEHENKIDFDNVYKCFEIYSNNNKIHYNKYYKENLYQKFKKLNSKDNKINFDLFKNFLIDEKKNFINELLYIAYDNLIVTNRDEFKKIFLNEPINSHNIKF